MQDDMMERFQQRMEAKKAAQPELFEYEATVKLVIKATSPDVAAETADIVAQHLMRFDDIVKAEGSLK